MSIFRIRRSYWHFNPRPPWGGRLYHRRQKRRLKLFQSTPSVGRATTERACLCPTGVYFNPRPPWGGRLADRLTLLMEEHISIHALRGEGDCVLYSINTFINNFNPRPPWGGRHFNG